MNTLWILAIAGILIIMSVVVVVLLKRNKTPSKTSTSLGSGDSGVAWSDYGKDVDCWGGNQCGAFSAGDFRNCAIDKGWCSNPPSADWCKEAGLIGSDCDQYSCNDWINQVTNLNGPYSWAYPNCNGNPNCSPDGPKWWQPTSQGGLC